MIPVLITAHLENGYISTGALNIDGLLMYAATSDSVQPQRTQKTFEPVEIPIESVEFYGSRIYLSTDAIAQPRSRTVSAFVTSNKDGTDVTYLNASFSSTAGTYRKVLKRYPLKLTPTLSWSCWGDINAIRHLLSRLSAIGALRSHGYGRITDWSVIEIPSDQVGKHGILIQHLKATRPIPVDWVDADSSNAIPIPVRPPYWSPTNVEMAFPTGSFVELRKEVIEELEMFDAVT